MSSSSKYDRQLNVPDDLKYKYLEMLPEHFQSNLLINIVRIQTTQPNETLALIKAKYSRFKFRKKPPMTKPRQI